mmetsp:Transcript_26508/g.44044  ORF Transcript_26508/g.44044 Transcript_26508/m.44044 type:complete len:294 (+) Transcript_26508:219-1100(+)
MNEISMSSTCCIKSWILQPAIVICAVRKTMPTSTSTGPSQLLLSQSSLPRSLPLEWRRSGCSGCFSAYYISVTSNSSTRTMALHRCASLTRSSKQPSALASQRVSCSVICSSNSLVRGGERLHNLYQPRTLLRRIPLLMQTSPSFIVLLRQVVPVTLLPARYTAMSLRGSSRLSTKRSCRPPPAHPPPHRPPLCRTPPCLLLFHRHLPLPRYWAATTNSQSIQLVWEVWVRMSIAIGLDWAYLTSLASRRSLSTLSNSCASTSPTKSYINSLYRIYSSTSRAYTSSRAFRSRR